MTSGWTKDCWLRHDGAHTAAFASRMHAAADVQQAWFLTQQRIDGTVRPKQLYVIPVMFTFRADSSCSRQMWAFCSSFIMGLEVPGRLQSWQEVLGGHAGDRAHLLAWVPQLKEAVLQVELAQ
jgi:hypothetical protein